MATTQERTQTPGTDGAAAAASNDNVAAAIAARCLRLPTVPVVGGQEGLRWHHLDGRAFLQRVAALAAELQTRGVQPGDRVVLWVPNGWRTPALFAAIWQAGAIAVPFDREMNPEAAQAILRLVEARLVITGYGQRPEWAAEAPVAEWWEPRAVAAPTLQLTFPSAGDDAVAAIYFTSGTTGSPKGCTITHRNLLSQVRVLTGVVPVAAGDVFGSILPLSHLFELTCGMLYPLVQGATVEYIPSRKGPDIVRVLSEQRVTHMVVVPQVLALMGAAAAERLRGMLGASRYEALLRLADRLPMGARRLLFWPVLRRLGGQLRMLASGGAALDPEVQRLWERMGVRTLQGYGASECSPIIACGRADGRAPYGTVGTPLPGVEVKLDAQGQSFVRGPNVMRGYWRDLERTAAVFDSEGFYATGDLCAVDAQGNIRIMGRATELLVLPSGLNVWPEDVEGQLRRVAGVKEAIVILVPAGGGATLHAYLLPDGPSEDTRLQTIVAEANGHLAAHQRVATASWWPEEDFPRTSTLKVKRRLIPLPTTIAAPVSSGPTKATAQEVDPLRGGNDPVLAAVRAITGNPLATEGQTLAELGLDSLGLTSLVVEIESRSGLSVPDGSLDAAMTVAAARIAVSGGGQAATPAEAGLGDELAKRVEEVNTWLPPLWLYTRGRILRRFGAPIEWLHRFAVPRTICLGAENLDALAHGAILAGTHRSFPDVPTIRRAINESAAHAYRDRLVIAASSVIVGRAGLLGRLTTVALGLFPLRQYSGQEQSLRRLAQIADAGNSILIFPQGHHTDPEAERRGAAAAAFKPGIGRLALDLGLPVLPFGLAGTELVVPKVAPEGFKGRVIAGVPVSLTRRSVAIAFGAPLRPQQGETAAGFAARLQEVCFALSRQAEDALPGDR